MRESAIVSSTLSSNRIEGVTVDPSRVKSVVFGRSRTRDRDEEEVRGYKNALNSIFSDPQKFKIEEKTIKSLHRTIRGDIWDAGKFKEEDGDIMEYYPDGRARVRFRTVRSVETPAFMRETTILWRRGLKERKIPPLLLAAAFNLDFLCIHPFRDGNGRVSRLLWLLQCLQFGFEVGRYISLEKIIEENKERYYETLEQSLHGWHKGAHDPWIYANFLLYVMKTAYQEFEERMERLSPRGSKGEMILEAIKEIEDPFTVAGIRGRCPGASIDLIRKIMKKERGSGRIRCMGRGPAAAWEKIS